MKRERVEIKLYFQGEWIELKVDREFWERIGGRVVEAGQFTPPKLLEYLLELEEKLFRVEQESKELVEKIEKINSI
jgi:hypothetical protein